MLQWCYPVLRHVEEREWWPLCNTLLQHSATHCNTVTTLHRLKTMHKSLQHTATHCNTLQHTATHCNTLLQHTAATHCNTLQHGDHFASSLEMIKIDNPQITATHCNTAATHCCNTLQHTATQWPLYTVSRDETNRPCTYHSESRSPQINFYFPLFFSIFIFLFFFQFLFSSRTERKWKKQIYAQRENCLKKNHINQSESRSSASPKIYFHFPLAQRENEIKIFAQREENRNQQCTNHSESRGSASHQIYLKPRYVVATMSRRLNIIGLFFRMQSLL